MYYMIEEQEPQQEHQEGSAKESYEAEKALKQQEKDRARGQQKGQKQTNNFVRYGIILAIVGVVGYGLFALIQKEEPQEEDLSKAFEILGAQHIDIGAVHPAYNSNPPSSGWHYSQPANTGFRKDAPADEHIVHSLEHGDIWIAYHPRVADEVRDRIKKFAGPRVVVTSREANDFDISLVAWGRVDSFNAEDDLVDEQRVRDFINRYKNRGPEKVTGPVLGGV